MEELVFKSRSCDSSAFLRNKICTKHCAKLSIFLPLLFNRVLKILATPVRLENEIKGTLIEKKAVKLSLFANAILCRGNTKTPPKTC